MNIVTCNIFSRNSLYVQNTTKQNFCSNKYEDLSVNSNISSNFGNNYISNQIDGCYLYHSVIDSLNDKLTNPWFCCEKLKKIEAILVQNKDEVERIFDKAFGAMQKKYNFKQSLFSTSDWKPYMSKHMAEDYVRGTKLENIILYRSSNSPEYAKQYGYKLSRVGEQYAGIYVSDSRDTALQYGGYPMALKLRVNNIVRLRDIGGFEYNLFNELHKNTDNDELLDSLKNIKGIVEYHFGTALNIDAFEHRVQAFEEDEPSNAYVVLNPKNIVIISG